MTQGTHLFLHFVNDLSIAIFEFRGSQDLRPAEAFGGSKTTSKPVRMERGAVQIVRMFMWGADAELRNFRGEIKAYRSQADAAYICIDRCTALLNSMKWDIFFGTSPPAAQLSAVKSVSIGPTARKAHFSSRFPSLSPPVAFCLWLTGNPEFTNEDQ
jgi:hypothetical protein